MVVFVACHGSIVDAKKLSKNNFQALSARNERSAKGLADKAQEMHRCKDAQN